LGHRAADRVVLAIRVDDLDATVSELRTRGASVFWEPSTAWVPLGVEDLRT